VNLFEFKIVLVPIHVGACHWALCAIDNQSRTISYYDSLSSAGDSSNRDMDALQTFIEAEYTQRVGEIPEKYKTSYAKTPRQENFSDCGVFVCFLGRRLARGETCEAPARLISKMRYQMSRELLASKLFPEDFLKDKTMAECLVYTTSAKCGIQNLNNTCFMSSTLQLLFHCEPFLKIIRGPQVPNIKGESILGELNDAYDNYINSNVLVPSKLVEVLSGLLPRYERGQQYDAEEFLNFLLQRVSKEVRECAQTFQSSMNIQLTCLECKAKVDVIEHSVMLPLSINKCRSVQD
ncbi:Sentrin-specific protease, partial [Frankliniella fusca]